MWIHFLLSIIAGILAGHIVAIIILPLANSKKCKGSHLIEGCNKRIFPIILYRKLLSNLLKKDLSRKYEIMSVYRNAQFERSYCCEDCLKKHEAIKIANILVEEPEKNYPFNSYLHDIYNI